MHILIFIIGTCLGYVVALVFIISKIDGLNNAVWVEESKERVRRFRQIK